MSKSDKKQPNKENDLLDVKELVRDAKASDATLDEILAEFGGTPLPPKVEPAQQADLPWPEAVRTQRFENNIVPFSPTQSDDETEETEVETDEDDSPELPSEQLDEKDGADEPAEPEKVIRFPETEPDSPLSAVIKKISRQADDYADQMFSEGEADEAAREEIRRLEQLIPGTDQERTPPEDVRYVRPKRPPEPPPKDIPPAELAKRYTRGLSAMRLRVFLLFLLSILSGVLLLLPKFGGADGIEIAYVHQIWISMGLLLLSMLVAIDIFWIGFARLFRWKPGIDTLLAITCLVSLGDAYVLSVLQNREGQLPYCGIQVIALFFQLMGAYQKRKGERLACRTAALGKEPYLITADEAKWNGQDAFCKRSGNPDGFGSQMQMDDGAQQMFKRIAPLLLLSCVLLSLLSLVQDYDAALFLWRLTAMLSAACGLGASLCYGRTFFKLTQRLAESGAALAGWAGAAQCGRNTRILLTDTDLFPPGHVELNGIKLMGQHSMEKVVGYTATLIRDSGSGLTKLFHNLLRVRGAIFRHAENISYHEGGGLSARIRNDEVFVGSAAFMKVMEVPLPDGLNVKHAVFCAIDGELAGIFALNYVLPDGLFAAMAALFKEKISPVLATRDFNLIPATLRRFRLAADRMDFPPIERRRALSDPEQEHNEILTAVLCREGITPFSEAVVGAKRLRRTTRSAAVLTCIGSFLGVMLTAYLTTVHAFSSISPLNLLLFLLMWMIPVWLLTDSAHRF